MSVSVSLTISLDCPTCGAVVWSWGVGLPDAKHLERAQHYLQRAIAEHQAWHEAQQVKASGAASWDEAQLTESRQT